MPFRRRWVLAGSLGLLVAASGGELARGQAVTYPSGHVHVPPDLSGLGPIRRATRHIGFTLHDRFIGDPAVFDIPPHGYDLYQTMASQTAKGNLHTFTLYRSDFVAGTTQLTPSGAYRLSLLATRLPAHNGPVLVEWIPESPDLAMGRRDAVLSQLAAARLPITADRVVVGPSPYAGLLGVDASNNYDTLIFRDLAAPRSYSLTPVSSAYAGSGGR